MNPAAAQAERVSVFTENSQQAKQIRRVEKKDGKAHTNSLGKGARWSW